VASTPVSLTIERDEITLDELGEIVRAFTAYLIQVDLSLSSTSRRTLNYRITHLSYSSPVQLAAVAEPKEERTDNGPAVLSTAIRGIAEVDAGGRPAGVRDDALEALATLADYGVNGRGLRIEAPTLSLRAPISKAVVAQVEKVLSRGEAVGALEGQLETISVHAQPYFTLYDAVSGRGVRCYFTEERRAAVVAAFGKKVIAHGRLRREPNGAPREMRDLDWFEVLGEPKGSLDNLPGVYAGVDSESALRDSRRA
jgi:hypothetical protein